MQAVDNGSWEVAWSEELSVGIPEIDEEHRRFLGLVDELNAAIAGRDSKARIEALLNAIVRDARAHFAHEEQLLAERGYAEARRHAMLHAGLVVQITAALHDIHDTQWSRFWIETGLGIKKVLLDHLLQEDMRFRAHFLPGKK